MRIYVFDRKKHYVAELVIKCVLVLVVSLSISFGVVIRGFGEELFIEAVNTENGNIIILDAGHGGEDCGAVGKGDVYEKDLNLSIVLEMGRIFEEKGYAVIYTRTDDRLLYKPEENIKGIRKISDLKNRCKVAAEYPEATFVSIHMNSFGDSKYSGLQVYYSENGDGSRLLAQSIQSTVREQLQNDNSRSIKAGRNIYVLENVTNTAVLVECGFLTNENECEKLSQKEYQKELSFSIVCGIIKYIEENS